jgi:DNA-binding response OmpR family regulator
MNQDPKILIVEDDRDLSSLFHMWLDRNGFEAVETHDVGGAIRALEVEPPPGAILLDIGLPREDGYALLEKLRSDARLNRTPVIVVTGYNPTTHKARCLEAGAADFFQKPVSWDDLKSALTRSLKGRAQ